MHAITALYGAILFVLLTPGLVLRIPSKGPLLHASIVHAIVFGILLYFICKMAYQYKYGVESFENTEIDTVSDAGGKNCNVNHCNTAIKNRNKNEFIPVSWWDKGQGCSGCTLSSNFILSNIGERNTIEDAGGMNCNLENCKRKINTFRNNNQTVPVSLWNNGEECAGCTVSSDFSLHFNSN